MYVKVFQDILSSSVWCGQPYSLRVAWIGLLTLGDDEGLIYGTKRSMSLRIDMPEEDFEEALQVLMAPDPSSSSQVEEGRRILPIGPNTWKIVNYEKYRDIIRREDRKAYMREYMREYRCKLDVNNHKQNVNPSYAATEASSEAATDARENETIGGPIVSARSRAGSAPGRPRKSSNSGSRIQWTEPGEWIGILETDKARWRKSYPAVDLDIELNRAADWIASNPKKKKKNYARFISAWLSRCQEKGGNGDGRKVAPGAPRAWSTLLTELEAHYHDTDLCKTWLNDDGGIITQRTVAAMGGMEALLARMFDRDGALMGLVQRDFRANFTEQAAIFEKELQNERTKPGAAIDGAGTGGCGDACE